MQYRGRGELWSIILAGGDGTRLQSLTRRLHDDGRPKQFAVLLGARSLLQETVSRFAPVVRSERTVVVVPARYQGVAEDQLAEFREIDIVSQPHNAGTGPGVLLPLARVVARAPDATVILSPSDHHFQHPTRLLGAVERAVSVAEKTQSGLCLVGVAADRAATDLGWIMPGMQLYGAQAAAIARFVEKPSSVAARALHRAGGLWNTFIAVGTARRLWDLSLDLMPQQARLFERYRAAVDSEREDRVLREVYASIAPSDFSRDVLTRAKGLGVVRMEGSGWSDWGTPERVFESLAGTPALALLEERLGEDPAAAAVFETTQPRAVV